eukprot:2498870-Pyramimonas_sp.AAC.1
MPPRPAAMSTWTAGLRPPWSACRRALAGPCEPLGAAASAAACCSADWFAFATARSRKATLPSNSPLSWKVAAL